MAGSKKVALVTGVTGQDGSYLTELLLQKGYEVHGIKRRASTFNTSRIDHILEDSKGMGANLRLHFGDLTDTSSTFRLLKEINPTEIYNLAAMSHVGVSFQTPEYVANADAMGTLRWLEAIRILGMEKTVKFYQASTSELYGKVQQVPQTETTPFYPRSPYAVAKLYGFWIVKNYREAYDMHVSNGILFNHESPRRGETFVTRKITMAVARIAVGKQDTLSMGNIDSQRDWGHAKEYVEGMWRILQQEKSDDYVLATHKTTSVRDFIKWAVQSAGIEIAYEGTGVSEVAKNIKTGKIVMKIDPQYFRPTEVNLLIGNPSKAKEKLGWEAKISADNLCKEMVESDLKLAREGKI